MERVADHFNVAISDLRSAAKVRRVCFARMIFCVFAVRDLGASCVELSGMLGLSPSAVSKAVAKGGGVEGIEELCEGSSDRASECPNVTDVPYPPVHGVLMALDSELSGTPAGDALARMREHAERIIAERKRREAYESPQAVEERKRVKREQRAIAHALRQSETRRRNAERLELLAALARLSAAERLSLFAKDAALKLDCVPAQLIPAQESDLNDLGMETAVALVARIGRRKGAWGRLRRMIEHQLKTASE